MSLRLEHLRKAGRYLMRGDLGGLMAAVRHYRRDQGLEAATAAAVIAPTLPEPNRDVLEAEQRFWAQTDIDLVRRVAWSSIPSLGGLAIQAMTAGKTSNARDLIVEQLGSRKSKRLHELRGLVLGCGEFAMECINFLDPRLSFVDIDAYDLNSSAFERGQAKAKEVGLEVNFLAADINRLVLPSNVYDLVVIVQSYHHVERIEYLAEQINGALTPGGVFFLDDYVGPRFLQYSQRQLAHAQPLLEALPEKYRLQIDGKVRHKIEAVAREFISPDEAVCSDLILDAVSHHFEVVWQYNWAGLLYPLLEGIAFNFSDDKTEDRALTDSFFHLDRELCSSGKIEPNFTYTVATKR